MYKLYKMSRLMVKLAHYHVQYSVFIIICFIFVNLITFIKKYLWECASLAKMQHLTSN